MSVLGLGVGVALTDPDEPDVPEEPDEPDEPKYSLYLTTSPP